MKKLMLMVAMLAMMLVAAVPAMAQQGTIVDQAAGDQEAESGGVSQSGSVINTGDNVNLCVAILNAANTGNAQNSQALLQYASESDEIEVDGGSISVSPKLVIECQQKIEQITTSVDQPKPDQPKPDQPKPDQPKPDQPKAPTGGGAKELPKTGGAALLALGGGGLLIGGGLLARRISR